MLTRQARPVCMALHGLGHSSSRAAVPAVHGLCCRVAVCDWKGLQVRRGHAPAEPRPVDTQSAARYAEVYNGEGPKVKATYAMSASAAHAATVQWYDE